MCFFLWQEVLTDTTNFPVLKIKRRKKNPTTNTHNLLLPRGEGHCYQDPRHFVLFSLCVSLTQLHYHSNIHSGRTFTHSHSIIHSRRIASVTPSMASVVGVCVSTKMLLTHTTKQGNPTQIRTVTTTVLSACGDFYQQSRWIVATKPVGLV